MTKKNKIILFLLLPILVFFIWAPWLDNKTIHDKVFKEKAHKDGTMAWVIYPDGKRKYELICDYKVKWFPFGRWVVSCEGGYFVTFFGKILF